MRLSRAVCFRSKFVPVRAYVAPSASANASDPNLAENSKTRKPAFFLVSYTPLATTKRRPGRCAARRRRKPAQVLGTIYTSINKTRSRLSGAPVVLPLTQHSLCAAQPRAAASNK